MKIQLYKCSAHSYRFIILPVPKAEYTYCVQAALLKTISYKIVLTTAQKTASQTITLQIFPTCSMITSAISNQSGMDHLVHLKWKRKHTHTRLTALLTFGENGKDISQSTGFLENCLQCFDTVGWAAGRASSL